MKKGLSKHLGREISIYSSPDHLLITGVVQSATCGFIVVGTNPNGLQLPRQAFICKRKLILKKIYNWKQKTPFSPLRYRFFVKTGHNIFTAPVPRMGGFNYPI
ncbi:hypothetical protein A2W50_00385 [Candidatus Nomurabacteria bacterium RIFCSPHIGHO2_02_40_30]|nr:MAG: hypothetical protein A2W50_00385 [Candidatus Nomurabacteria bacterium RIFCSPHIGHO2_02_40_30]